jgi:hypothetical protein
MRRVCVLASLLAAAAGSVYADPTATLVCNQTGAESSLIPGGDLSGGCFTNQFINTTALDSLNWGSAGASGTSLPVSTYLAADFQTVGYEGVAVQLAPTYSGGSGAVETATNVGYVWAAHPTVGPARWVIPGTQGTPAVNNPDAGHFNSASPAGQPPNVNAPAPGTPVGDSLLELQSGGPMELTFLKPSVFGAYFEISSLVGTADASFDASVEALDSSGNILGTYNIQAGGSGGTCTSVSHNPPTPCNDAPYIGFYDPQGRIHSIYISVTDPSTGYLVGFAIDTLMVDDAPVPEPSIPLMVGGGLAAFSLLRRWRRTRSG